MVDMPSDIPLVSPGDKDIVFCTAEVVSSILRPENRLLVVVLVKHLVSEQLSNLVFLEWVRSVCC